ncbi:hypothetical protein BS17DRAFT_783940 [Gyrodon lividus]|nr:hypothetical protein BS17DRAFT_783940 [Gyrodon lividus]
MEDSRSTTSHHASCCPLSALGCYANLHMPTTELHGPHQTHPDACLSPTISFGM